ncbi:MAG: hypothetical protein QMC67_02170 [Candidatus Wallbacteria bacterium]
MLMKTFQKSSLIAIIAIVIFCFFMDISVAYCQVDVTAGKSASQKTSSKKKKKKKTTSDSDVLKAAGSAVLDTDSSEVMVDKLGFDYVAAKDGENIKQPKPEPKKPYTGSFFGNTLMGSNGLIEIAAPDTTPRGKFQIGAQYLHRRIQTTPSLQLNARVMFQTISFGVLKNAEIGFGSSGYYKSSNNTTFLTGKFRVTNPEKTKFQASVGFQAVDFGSSGVTNSNNYFGLFSYDVSGSNIYFQVINDGNNSSANLTVKGGVIVKMKEIMSQPSCLIVEAIQDYNNNFSKYNFGVRTPIADNALFDLFLMKDINLNELSPAVGVNLKF